MEPTLTARVGTARLPARAASVCGKFLHVGEKRFPVRGVTYGTFRPGELGLLPDFDQVKADFVRMVEAGVNTVRTYTPPHRRILDLAYELDLKLLVGVWWEDPRYLDVGKSWSAMEAEACRAVVEAAQGCAGHPAVLGLLLGNEIPGSVVRFHGRRKVERLLRRLYSAGKEAAPETLFSYANYPTTQYLDTSFFDFECVNVFLEDERAYRRYLAQVQVEAGDRPVVLTEVGLDSGADGVQRQAEVLDWQLRAAMEAGMAGTCVFSWTDEWWVGGQPVEGWSFGVTWADREPKPALGILADRYRSGLLGCRDRWPKVTVVVCAYQEADNIERCLESLVSLHYPDYEVLVVDDGSTDGTAAKAARFPVRVLEPGRQGLSGARNTGLAHATGEVVAYIDADASADPDWLTFLVLGLEPADAAGVGGPNLCPPDAPPVAQCIGRAPGGPVHVLIDNTRAEHIPGCNMAFRRDRLREIGGFDPTYRTAGDDVDLCWRLQDGDFTVRFHPAALVWHLPRSRVRDFWRQQVGYGRAEALVARNHPDKVDGRGRATWRGVIYGPASIVPGRSAVYGGQFGSAPYQRLYLPRGGLNVVAALYLIAGLVAMTAVDHHLFLLPLLGIGALLAAALATGIRRARRDGLGRLQGLLIGLLHILQPVAREVGRLRFRPLSFPLEPDPAGLYPTLRRVAPGLFVADGIDGTARQVALEAIRRRLRAARIPTRSASPWDDADLVCSSALLWQARIVTYAQWDRMFLRVDINPRRPRWAGSIVLVFLLVASWSLTVAAEAALLLVVLLAADRVRFRRRVGRALAGGSEAGSMGQPDAQAPDEPELASE